MRTAQQAASRPRVQNQTTTNRRAQATATRPATRLRSIPPQAVAPRPRRRTAAKKQAAPLPNGLSVMGVLLAASAVLGLMFVVALGWQRNAYNLAQQEVELRSSLDQVSDERQQLMVENRRALNPRETSARSENELKDIKLDQRTAATPQKPATANTTPKVVAKVVNNLEPLKAAAEKAAASITAKNNNNKSTQTTR
jgi:hypothetical protein